MKPLSQLIAENEHQNTIIDYLKVHNIPYLICKQRRKNIILVFAAFSQIDIEEYEFSEGGFQDWIKSGALVNVNQIALELHVLHKESNPR